MAHTSPGSSKRTPAECWELVLTKAEKLSRTHFRSNLMESWVEDIERLIPLLPSAMNHFNFGTPKERSCKHLYSKHVLKLFLKKYL